jgi:hypothetical protein
MSWSTGCFLEQPTRARHKEAEVDVDKQGVLGYGGLFRGEDRMRYTLLIYVITVSSNALRIICVYGEPQDLSASPGSVTGLVTTLETPYAPQKKLQRVRKESLSP